MVRVTGDRDFSRRLSAARSQEAVRLVGQALFVAGNRIQVAAQNSITNGAVSGKNHVPSSPGEPPNADTHGLDRQIETVQVAPLKVEVTSNAAYSAPLEFGTSRMEARPFMKPATDQERAGAVDLVRQAVDRATRRR